MNIQFYLALNFAMHYLSYWWQAKDVIILSDEFTFVCLCVPSFVIRFDQFLSVYFLFCFVVALEISNDQYFLLYIIFISYFTMSGLIFLIFVRLILRHTLFSVARSLE